MRVIGDIHCNYDKYLSLVKEADKQGKYTVQLGDFGFDYQCLDRVDKSRHFVLLGNHENYNAIFPANVLYNFGLFNENCFYVRGAFSIDRQRRIEGISWFRNEELNYVESIACMKEYERIKPEIMFSHDCPTICLNNFKRGLPQSHTRRLLQELFEIHRPRMWLFGHHHVDVDFCIKNTRFIGLGELSYFDI
jgi:predicted phosphodiesterase